jgi:hypothetical protein
MSSPVEERRTYLEKDKRKDSDNSPTSDNGTYVTEPDTNRNGGHLKVDTTSYAHEDEDPPMRTPSARREQATRLDDDLMLLQAERMTSHSTGAPDDEHDRNSIKRARSRRSEAVDEFDEATNPLHEKTAIYKPPEKPNTQVAVFVKKLHQSSFLVRYLTYISPLVLILLIPLLVGALKFPNASVGGVELMWFSIWLEIVWLTLWAGRVSPMNYFPPRTLTNQGFFCYSLLASASLQLLVFLQVYSPITRRNGATWPNSSSFTQRSFSGGSVWRSPSCLQ